MRAEAGQRLFCLVRKKKSRWTKRISASSSSSLVVTERSACLLFFRGRQKRELWSTACAIQDWTEAQLARNPPPTPPPPPLSLSLSPGRWVSNSVASAGLGVAAAAATVAWWASLLPKNYQFFLFFLVKTCFFRGVFFVFFLGSGEESVLSVSRLYWVYWWFIFWVNGFSCLCRLLDFNVRQAVFIWTELGFCQVSPIHYHARLNFIRVVRFVNFTQPWSLSIFISFQWAGMKQKDYIGFSLASHVVIRVALPDFISLIFLLSLKHP